jgi:hypothetical protein
MGKNASKPQGGLNDGPTENLIGQVIDLKVEQMRRQQYNPSVASGVANLENHAPLNFSPTHPRPIQAPSQAVIDILKAGLEGIGPLSAQDSHVLTRVLDRLSQIEATEGEEKARIVATLVAQVFGDLGNQETIQ